jgi:hypothetical protein
MKVITRAIRCLKIRRAMQRLPEPGITWTDCRMCGRDNVAAHTMTDGLCARCTAIISEAGEPR